MTASALASEIFFYRTLAITLLQASMKLDLSLILMEIPCEYNVPTATNDTWSTGLFTAEWLKMMVLSPVLCACCLQTTPPPNNNNHM